MTRLLALLLLLPSLASAQYSGWTETGTLGAGTVTIVTGTPVVGTRTGGGNVTVNIPASTWLTNDVIVVVNSSNDNTCGTPGSDYTMTATGLTFTRRVCQYDANNGQVGIWTAVAGSNQGASPVTVTAVDTDGSNGAKLLTAYVLRNASTSGPWNLVTTTAPGSTSTAFSTTLSGESGSFYAGGWHGVTTDTTATPNGVTMEDGDYLTNYAGHNASTGTSQSLGGTWASTQVWIGAMIEVRALPASPPGFASTGGTGATVPVVPLSIESGFPYYTATQADATTIATPQFSTAGASLIVVTIKLSGAGNWTAEPSSMSGNTLGAMTALVTKYTNWTSSAAVYYLWSSGVLTNEVITATWANNQGWRGITVFSFLGASQTQNGATNTVTGSTSYPAVLSLSGTTSGSWVVGALDNGWAGVSTVGSGTAAGASDGHGICLHKTASSAGGTVTLDTTAPGTGNPWYAAVAEIKAQ